MKKGRERLSQLSFLPPADADFLNRGRIALSELVAVYEARQAKRLDQALQIRAPKDIYNFVRFEMENLEQEQLHVITLNTKNRILSAPMIYKGSVHTTVVRLAEVFRPAILDNASGLVIVHNHPSGDCSPSPEDAALTREIVKAGQLLDVDVFDHVIIGRGNPGFISLKERGLF